MKNGEFPKFKEQLRALLQRAVEETVHSQRGAVTNLIGSAYAELSGVTLRELEAKALMIREANFSGYMNREN